MRNYTTINSIGKFFLLSCMLYKIHKAHVVLMRKCYKCPFFLSDFHGILIPEHFDWTIYGLFLITHYHCGIIDVYVKHTLNAFGSCIKNVTNKFFKGFLHNTYYY